MQGVILQLEEGTGWEKPDKAAEVCIAFEAKLNDKVDSLRQIQSNAPRIHRSPLHTTYNCTCTAVTYCGLQTTPTKCGLSQSTHARTDDGASATSAGHRMEDGVSSDGPLHSSELSGR